VKPVAGATLTEAEQAVQLDRLNRAAAKQAGCDMDAPYWRQHRRRTRKLRRRVRRHRIVLALTPRRRDRRPAGGRPRARTTARRTSGASRDGPDEPGEPEPHLARKAAA
jgi:hypothetical protein